MVVAAVVSAAPTLASQSSRSPQALWLAARPRLARGDLGPQSRLKVARYKLKLLDRLCIFYKNIQVILE